ncbi:MAG: hypothetical protein GXP27_14060 [Planctomycetes bacterium]|nr:hypothetical protein [Planctomycetota bacterium]
MRYVRKCNEESDRAASDSDHRQPSAFGNNRCFRHEVGGCVGRLGWMVAVGLFGLGGDVFLVATCAADKPDWKAEFLTLCDAGRKIVEKQARTEKRIGRAFYWDSYVVRALAVAYDMTGRQEYLDACRLWSDRMLQFQRQMIPPGAYYMQYGRHPGQTKGNWYVADCSSIALGVLATAVRCDEPEDKARYLKSVQDFARLVVDRFVRPSGGVTDGYWPKSDKEWWCSTGIFGSLAFHLHAETGDPSYLRVGLGTIDWLNRQDLFRVAVHFPPKQITPTVLMYCLEAYSAGLPYLKVGTERYRLALTQLGRAHQWMLENWEGRAGIDYVSQWGSKFGGLPMHVYVFARQVPGKQELVQAADRELRHIAGILKTAPPSNQRDQLALFAMMSYAEKLCPGALDRASCQSRAKTAPRR